MKTLYIVRDISGGITPGSSWISFLVMLSECNLPEGLLIGPTIGSIHHDATVLEITKHIAHSFIYEMKCVHVYDTSKYLSPVYLKQFVEYTILGNKKGDSGESIPNFSNLAIVKLKQNRFL